MEKVKSISKKGLTKDLINEYSILDGAKYFNSGILQNYFVFIPAKKYIKCFSGTTRIYSWKWNGMSEENIENITKSDSNFAPIFVNHFLWPDLSFNGHCLTNNNIPISKRVINLHIFYILNPWLRNSNTDFTLNDSLFGSVKVTKDGNLVKYNYSSYGIGFDPRSQFSFADGRVGKNVIIFGADMSSSAHIENENKDTLILGEGPKHRD